MTVTLSHECGLRLEAAPAVSSLGIAPHGGELVSRVATSALRARLIAEAASLPHHVLEASEIADLEMIASGALSPLTGFMLRDDYESTIETLHLANGLPWTIPITLRAHTAPAGDRLALRTRAGNIIGVIEVAEVWRADREREAAAVYATTDRNHPGVRRLLESGELAIGGDVWLFQYGASPFPDLALGPAQTRRIFAERGWRTIVGFQTRNPVHRAHEYIQKAALETVDGLLLHPLVGETKDDDIPASVRVKSYQTLLEHYYPRDRVLLAAFPAAMRYAGPREAVFHAIARKNYGCTHFIVGRDHAGVGSYYGTYDAQRIFERFDPDRLGIQIIRFEHTFYCAACQGMASPKTCPHDATEHVALSGTRVRELLRAGELPPPEFSRREVARVLVDGLAASPA
jgi:sulfate adenylyltransferase